MDTLTLLPSITEAVRAAGTRLLDEYTPDARPSGSEAIWKALRHNDEAVLDVLRPALLDLRPQARWMDDELESGALPPGEWWVVDPAEGNINHVHGLPDWCVTATLVQDNAPVLTVVHSPVADRVHTAHVGHGARVDGVPLHVSGKADLAAAFVSTAQAAPGEDAGTLSRISASVDAMLRAAMLVRVAVPATVQLLAVAEGHTDAFWQHSPVISGLAAGALLVSEAGGVVTDLTGRPWAPGSTDFLAAAPGLHAAALTALTA
ncbi:inositol monophosphatase family protein [Actinokineospora bangkokensis]|uniref:3'(2'),5'-bisphosphate nucleotidase CysQ n=1 Tax=Actinokineospora bangkokensis TaxID=1193682 RepID=A0A1Q9LJP9_9PSEU|nr:inositol monophosphatase family protein [Actinokineospora bangkokensis]OLR92271.1 3'(2'),5'-bisphosphate nucleotidase CysQ [Actinokineospora bangkokensis]